ncbi:MAG: hypothetical protein H6545_03210 [Bacteroidales bacterium]|jgi:hypothetical protein|nr:hypothetical protein [Bacteroidales bacterium]MCB9028111.1 hypothetical protein [Bacteroidales bacterium]HNT92547.1 hypothetical protein [Bacteroidales bacterium]HOO66811.1 hypothetical protein [Bacteroidales bacterium]HPE22184.1 hypothetical protein [Bacteroidales bacterium]
MSVTRTAVSLLLLLCISLFSCINQGDKTARSPVPGKINRIGYDLSGPEKTMILPPSLLEVSGIAVIDSTTVACIQDENGIIFIFDLGQNEITDHFTFYYAGDYEGIARVDSSFFVLRSDGVIFEIRNPGASEVQTHIIPAAFPAAEYEGICFDQDDHRLLIVPKTRPGRGSGEETNHPVYGYDTRSGTPFNEAVLELHLSSVIRYASENELRMDEGKNDTGLRISAVAIHPLTNLIFAVSAVNRMLYVFNNDGTVNYIERLNPDLFNLPEGISFHDNGDMLISNEGSVNPPSLLLFKYQLP